MTVLWPQAIGQEEDYILFSKGDGIYESNSGLDSNNDGVITKKEATQKVIEKREEYCFN